MALILDGNTEIGAHVYNAICNLIYLMHLFRLTAVENLKLINKSLLLRTCARGFELPS